MIVIDTQVLVWMHLAPEKLSRPAEKAINVAETMVIPSISLWEISMLVHYGRMVLPCTPLEWFSNIYGLDTIHLQDITPQIAVISGSTKMHGDPADRLVVATAKAMDLPLVTADHKIRDLGLVTTIW